MKAIVAALLFVVILASKPAHAGVSIVFDYSLDSNGFFTPERRAIAQAAASSLTARMDNSNWARVDASALGGSYELALINPSTMAVTWLPNVVIPENQITVYLGAMDWSRAPIARMRASNGDSVTQLLAFRNVTGGVAAVLTNPAKLRPINASISFDLQGIQGLKAGIERQWYFGSAANLNRDDRNPADPLYNNYVDFYTSLLHELGHVLGIYDPVAMSSACAPGEDFCSLTAPDANFYVAWSSRVQSDGNGGYVFTGSRASQYYYNHVGQPIPLDAATRSHWATGVHSQTADGWPSVSYDGDQPFRFGFSELEFRALEDMGYTITPAAPITISINLVSGWNLTGNGSSGAFAVDSIFGDSSKVTSVWKWNAGAAKWAFYSPTLTSQALRDYAATRGYDLLTTILGGEGFWVNAKTAFTAQLSAAPALSSPLFQHLPSGWSLIATGDNPTPAQFDAAIASGNTTPPASGQVYTNLNSIWAWNAAQQRYYFWAPALVNSGGLASYLAAKGYLDFATIATTPPGSLAPSVGFWVNLP